jgi:hypothetical protein
VAGFDEADLLSYMRGHRLAVVSSIGPQGQPQSALVGIAVSPLFEVIFDTTTDTRKHVNLERDARSSVTFSGPGERTLQFEGVARQVSVSAPQDRALREIYYAAWPDGRSRLNWPKLVYWCITPRWARFSDFAAGPLVEEFEWS